MSLFLRIYVACRFEEYRRVLRFQNLLTLLGHVVTCDWSQHAEEHPDYFKQKPGGVDREMIALAEMAGVQACDLLIVFPHPEGASAYAETFGACLLGKPVIAISENGRQDTDRTFLHLPFIKWVKDEGAALELIQGARR